MEASVKATDAEQIRKERVLSAGLSVRIQSDGFATERTPNLLVETAKIYQKAVLKSPPEKIYIALKVQYSNKSFPE